MDLLQIVPQCLRDILLPQAQLRQSGDRRHRSPHIMGHMGKEGLFLSSGADGFPEGPGHLFDLILVVHLLRGIHKGQHQTLQDFVPGGVRRGLCPVGGDPYQVSLSGFRSAEPLHGLLGLQHVPAELDQVNGREIVGDITQGTSHVLIQDIELAGDVLGEFPDIQFLVHHKHAHQGRGQEIRHIVVQAGKFCHLGLILGVDRVKLFVDRLQFLVGGLQLFAFGEELFVGSLQFRVHRFQFCHGLAEIVFRVAQLLLQIRDPLGSCRVNIVKAQTLGRDVILPQEGHRDITGLLSDMVRDGIRDDRNVFRLVAELDRDFFIPRPFIRSAGILQYRRDRYLQVIPQQKENIQCRHAGGDRQKT